MKDRSLLLLLVVTVAFIFYVKPATEKNSLLRSQVAVLDSQIAFQKNFRAKSGEIDKRLKASGTAAGQNNGYLFPAGQSESLAMVELQEMVRRLAIAEHLEVVSATWGEPVMDGKNLVTRLPMSFVVKGLPPELDTFLRKLSHGGRFVKIERASIAKQMDQVLQLNFSLVAFRRDDQHAQ
jgi:Tfp pilus assembly protein PilO